MRVYLAGPIFCQSDEQCRTWRNDLKEAFPEYEWVDPMDRDYRGSESMEAERIVAEDKQAILGCDAILANITSQSAGTAMEILFAKQNGLHVVLCNNTYRPISPWYLAHADTVVSGGIRGGVVHGLAVYARLRKVRNEVFGGYKPEADASEVQQITIGDGATANAAD